MSKIKLTVAQALIKFLDQQYVEVDGVEIKFVKGIFSVFGHGNVLGLGQALEQDSGALVVHQGRNEQGMVHAAIGYAKQKLRRQIYACTSSVGPGAANMLTAAATATAGPVTGAARRGATTARRGRVPRRPVPPRRFPPRRHPPPGRRAAPTRPDRASRAVRYARPLHPRRAAEQSPCAARQ